MDLQHLAIYRRSCLQSCVGSGIETSCQATFINTASISFQWITAYTKQQAKKMVHQREAVEEQQHKYNPVRTIPQPLNVVGQFKGSLSIRRPQFFQGYFLPLQST